MTSTLQTLIAARDALELAITQLKVGRRFLPSHGSFGEDGIDRYEEAELEADAALAALRDAIQKDELASSMNLTLSWDGNSGDGKRAFVLADQNDGWKDLRIEVDTDDCDSKCARTMMEEVIRRVNALNRPRANTSEGRT